MTIVSYFISIPQSSSKNVVEVGILLILTRRSFVRSFFLLLFFSFSFSLPGAFLIISFSSSEVSAQLGE